MKVFLELMWFFKLEKKAYITGVIMLMFVAFMQVVPPKVIGIIVDGIETGTLTGRSLVLWMALIIAVGLAMYVLRYYWRIMIFGSAVKLSRLLRNKLYRHLPICRPHFINASGLET